MSKDSAAARAPAVVSPQYMTKNEALAALNIRERTLQDWVKQGFIASEKNPQPGQREKVYRAEDVQAIVANGGPPRRRAVTEQARQPRALPPPPQPLLLAAPSAPPAPAMQAPWISIEQFAELANLSQNFIRESIDTLRLPAIRGGPHRAWRIRRELVEKWEG